MRALKGGKGKQEGEILDKMFKLSSGKQTLLTLSFLSFGSHFCKSALSIFAVFLIKDGTWTPFGFGTLLASSCVPAILLPIWSGSAFDNTASDERSYLTVGLVGLTLMGQLLFGISLSIHSFELSIISITLLGGVSAVLSTAQRTLICSKFSKSLSYSTGIYISVANIAKVIAKASVSPIWEMLGKPPIVTMVYLSILPILLSLGASIHYIFIQNDYIEIDEERDWEEVDNNVHCNESGIQLRNLPSSLASPPRLRDTDTAASSESNNPFAVICILPLHFWLFCSLHGLYLVVFHLFINFLPSILSQTLSTDASGYSTAIMSLVPIFVAPMSGYLLDRFPGYHLKMCIVAAILTVAAYMILFQSLLHPIGGIVILAICQALISTITLTCMTAVLPQGIYGRAFGVIEMLDSSLALTGNLLFGWLYNFTGKYTSGMELLLVLAVFGLFAFVFLQCSGLKVRTGGFVPLQSQSHLPHVHKPASSPKVTPRASLNVTNSTQPCHELTYLSHKPQNSYS